MDQAHVQRSRREIDDLMDLATILADFTSTPTLVDQIPHILDATLQMGPVTFAVLQQREGGAGFVWFAHSQHLSAEAHGNVQRHVLHLDQQNAGHAKSVEVTGHATDAASPGAGVVYQMTTNPADGTIRGELLIHRTLSPQHRMVLILTPKKSGSTDTATALAGFNPDMLDMIELISDHLGRQLSILLSWMNDPANLGLPFDRLTEREWAVLQALDSEDGEKQLADRLKLSPHTLHSHIKAIYRKLGVQGRLPVLLQLAKAQQALRLKFAVARLTGHQLPPPTKSLPGEFVEPMTIPFKIA